MNVISDMVSTRSAATDQEFRKRARTLSWMASLSVAAGVVTAGEGYLLELLAWCAFGDRGEDAGAEPIVLALSSNPS